MLETDALGRKLWTGRGYDDLNLVWFVRLICRLKGHIQDIANVQGPPGSYCRRCGSDLPYELRSFFG